MWREWVGGWCCVVVLSKYWCVVFIPTNTYTTHTYIHTHHHHQVGLVDTRGSAPIIRNVPVPTDTNAPVLEFADVLPLDCLLVPVGSCREMVDAAVEALVADKDAPDAAVEAAIGVCEYICYCYSTVSLLGVVGGDSGWLLFWACLVCVYAVVCCCMAYLMANTT